MFKGWLAGIGAPPPLGPRLWLTLAAGAGGAANLIFLREIWPHTPAAKAMLVPGTCATGLLLLPQLLWWAWRWLRAYAGPAWLRVLAMAVYLGGTCLALGIWLLLAGSLVAMLLLKS